MDFQNIESLMETEVTKIYYSQVLLNILRFGGYVNKTTRNESSLKNNEKIYSKFNKYFSNLLKENISSKDNNKIDKSIVRSNLIFKLNSLGKMPAVNDKSCLNNLISLKINDQFTNNDLDGFIKNYGNVNFFGDIPFNFYLSKHEYAPYVFQNFRLLFYSTEIILFKKNYDNELKEIFNIMNTLNTNRFVQKTIDEDPYITETMPVTKQSMDDIIQKFMQELNISDEKKVLIKKEMNTFLQGVDIDEIESEGGGIDTSNIISKFLNPQSIEKMMNIMQHLDRDDIQICVDFLTQKVESVKGKVKGPMKLLLPKILDVVKNPSSIETLLPTISAFVPGLNIDKIMNDPKLNETITKLIEKKKVE